MKDSVAGSSLFYDSDVDKSNKDDIEKIFDDKIETEEVLRTCQKIKSKEQIYAGDFGYNDFDECEQALLRGFDCVKHNYTDGKVKTVRLYLSKDKKAICYKEKNPKNNLLAKIKGPRVIPFESM